MQHHIKKAHFVGSSVVITIDPGHVRRLGVDDLTFFVEKPIENGIILEVRKLYSDNKIEQHPDKRTE
jgi:hypothetical protein